MLSIFCYLKKNTFCLATFKEEKWPNKWTITYYFYLQKKVSFKLTNFPIFAFYKTKYHYLINIWIFNVHYQHLAALPVKLCIPRTYTRWLKEEKTADEHNFSLRALYPSISLYARSSDVRSPFTRVHREVCYTSPPPSSLPCLRWNW